MTGSGLSEKSCREANARREEIRIMKNDKQIKTALFFALIIFGAVILLLTAACWGIIKLSGFINYLENGPVVLRILIGIGFLLLFAGVVYLIIKTVSFGKATSKGEMNLLTQGTDGSTYISSDAISTMVQRLLHRNRQIRSASCSVTPVSDGITIDIRLTVLAGGDYAQLCSDIQRDIKQEVEQATGIPVKNVSVSIIKTIVPNGEQAPVEKRVK